MNILTQIRVLTYVTTLHVGGFSGTAIECNTRIRTNLLITPDIAWVRTGLIASQPMDNHKNFQGLSTIYIECFKDPSSQSFPAT